eukprot:GEMP01063262.1.p1 GENE.GEMP01063262.1~~GEMP01063262.1.p1  ORF type:complete len:210 (+),score=63.47 GEMP01063262.1:150-779(+)
MRVFMTLLALGRHMSTPWEGQAFRDLVQDVNAFDSDDVDATRDQSAADELLDAVPTQRRDFLRTSTRNSDVATPSMIDPSMGSATSADPPEVATQLNMANPADEPPVPTVVPPAVMEQPPVASAESPVEPLARLADSRVGSWRTNPHHCQAHVDCQSTFCGFLPASPRALDPISMGGYVCAPCPLCVPTSNRTPNGSVDGKCPSCYARR